ncbi:hypothetical protein FJ693_15280, partial [Georgenia yuyongxinii]
MSDAPGRSLLRRPATWGLFVLVVVLTVLGTAWWTSLVPGTISVMDMGYPDFGGGSAVAHGPGAGAGAGAERHHGQVAAAAPAA